MLSMTGFGCGEATRAGNRVRVEITAVNSRKQAEIRFAAPREFASFETAVATRVRETVSRGYVTVSVNYEASPKKRQSAIRIDKELAGQVIKLLRELACETGIDAELRAGELLQVPGIISETPVSPDKSIESALLAALGRALAQLQRMRMAEGGALQDDLGARLQSLRALLADMRRDAEQVLARWQQRLHERIETLGVELKLDDERLAREAAFCAERSDITEEIVRLDSHLSQFEELLASNEPSGRALEFLCQEMNREVSTVCAKTCDTGIADAGLAFKTELGRVREQIQNVE